MIFLIVYDKFVAVQQLKGNNMFKKIKEILTKDYEKERVERYLSEATDIYDLEARMREIDRGYSKHILAGQSPDHGRRYHYY